MSEHLEHPINAFPDTIQEIINHYSETKGYPIEYFITAVLAAASTAMGRAVTLNTGSYTAISIIWAAIIGKPGLNKSEAQTDAFKAIKNMQFKYFKDYERDCDELEQFRSQNPKAKTEDIKQPPKFILSDITPEALSMTLSANPKGCGIVYDELAGFVGRFNRYNSGADEQMFLSLFNGDTIIRTRVDGKGNAAIKNSYLTIIGTIQPAVMKEVFIGKEQSGFFDRWLICYPENIVKQYPNMSGVDPSIEAKYHIIIDRLMALKYDEYNDQQMIYNPESHRIIFDFQCSLIDIENETQNDSERSILAKIEIYVHRFALILQALEYADISDFLDPSKLVVVSVRSAKGAVILAKYFLDQANKMRVINPVENLKDNWKTIYDALPEHGKSFDRAYFSKICDKFNIKQSRADIFLKEHADRSETKLFYKVSHGQYTKNLF